MSYDCSANLHNDMKSYLTRVELYLTEYKQFIEAVEFTAGLTDQVLTLVANLHNDIKSYLTHVELFLTDCKQFIEAVEFTADLTDEVPTLVANHYNAIKSYFTRVELCLTNYKQFIEVVEFAAGLTDQVPTLVVNLHDAIESFVDFEGREEASRNLHEAAGMIAHLEKEMPQLADKHVKYVLGDADFKQWLDEGRTYASFARLFLGCAEKVSAKVA